MSPVYYRCEDDESRAQYQEGYGIEAEANRWVPFYPGDDLEQQKHLEEELFAHLDWSNRYPTVFISTSSNVHWVLNEAWRREREGKTNVKVYKITVPHDVKHYNKSRNCSLTFAKVKTWLERADSEIPEDEQYDSFEHECLFLHHIPDDLISEML